MAKIKRRLKVESDQPPDREKVETFTKHPNSSIDSALQSRKINLAGRCYLFIVRKTAGWHEETQAIPLKEFVGAVGGSRANIIKALNGLEVEGTIFSASSTEKRPKIYSLSPISTESVVSKTRLPKQISSIENETIGSIENETIEVSKTRLSKYRKRDYRPIENTDIQGKGSDLKKLKETKPKKSFLKKANLEKEFLKIWSSYEHKAKENKPGAREKFFGLRETHSDKKIYEAVQDFILEWSSKGRTLWPQLSTVFTKHLEEFLVKKRELTVEEWLRS